MISVITVTYGRTAFLAEAIEAFYMASENCDEPSEMVILNTCPKQVISLREGQRKSRSVRIINLDRRPPSLGQARNMAIEKADGDIIVIADDDDIMLEDHLSAYASAFRNNGDCHWILLNSQFYMEGDKIKDITQGACHMLSFTKEAWKSVGGYPSLTCGEDRGLVKSITERFNGKKITLPVPSYIYRWGQGTYHASGQGDDRLGMVPVHERIAQDLDERVRAGKEPVGTIVLDPHPKLDYLKMASEFMAKRKAGAPKSDSVCMVELGRYGDIVNVLPIAKHLHDTGTTPFFMVGWEFRDILDGVSYVNPWPVRLGHGDLIDALTQARKRFRTVLNCQIWGVNYVQDQRCETFNQESWRMAGFLDHFTDPTWPLVFDKRDPERERHLRERLFRTDKPKIVCNLTSAISAPFSSGKVILSRIGKQFSEYEVVDIGPLRCLYPFDILGLFDAAAVIISIDTLTLHLAQACHAPLVCIVRDDWQGATPRYNCAARFTYSEASDDPSIITDAVVEALAAIV